jgi:hypothetical protein
MNTKIETVQPAFLSPPTRNKMGQLHSSDCLDMKDYLSADDYAKLVGEDYTVVRTSGEEQTGFRIPSEPHECPKNNTHFLPAAHATRITPSAEPKFFMTTENNHCLKDCIENHEHNDHVCGWRVCTPKRRTFWPSRLSGDEKEAWFKWFDELIAPLPFPTRESQENERIEQQKAEEEKEKVNERARYEQTEAVMKNMLKEEAEKVKAKTGCQCASVLDCKPCVYGAQGRPLDS